MPLSTSNLSAATDAPSMTLLTDPDVVLSALSPVRRRILAALTEPASAAGIAVSLGLTRQKVNYHVRALEAAGLVTLHEERPRRGLTERVMRRSQDVVLVDPDTFADVDLSGRQAVGVAGVVSAASDLIRHASTIARRATTDGSKVAAATLDTEIRLRDPEAMRSLIEDLADVLARHDSPEGLMFRVSTSMLPTVP